MFASVIAAVLAAAVMLQYRRYVITKSAFLAKPSLFKVFSTKDKGRANLQRPNTQQVRNKTDIPAVQTLGGRSNY